MDERRLTIPDPNERADFAAFLTRALRLDEAAVVRLTSGAGGRMRVWARTPFGALVVRGLGGHCPGGDVVKTHRVRQLFMRCATTFA